MEYEIKLLDIVAISALIKGSYFFKNLINAGIIQDNQIEVNMVIENIIYSAIEYDLTSRGYRVISNMVSKFKDHEGYQDLITMLVHYQLTIPIPDNVSIIGLTVMVVGDYVHIGIRRI